MNSLVCPDCKSAFVVITDILKCSHCGQEYSIRQGIPVIRKSSNYFYEYEFSQHSMSEILKKAEREGWETALSDSEMAGDRRISNYYKAYNAEERRAAWMFLLPLSKKSVVLDYGCGTGSISSSLARRCGKVVSVDATFERVKLWEIRSRQSAFLNVEPICWDGACLGLPFRDEYFDLVVLNGVLEWIPTSQAGAEPRRIQLNRLLDIRRVLRRDGVLYIGIENRYGLEYLLGRRDHHSGLRFATVLPRCVSVLYSKAVKGIAYRSYTYSWWGYKRLLRQAGFVDMEFYFPFPIYQHFKYLAPLANKKILGYLISITATDDYKSRIANCLNQLGLLKYLVTSFGIVAK